MPDQTEETVLVAPGPRDEVREAMRELEESVAFFESRIPDFEESVARAERRVASAQEDLDREKQHRAHAVAEPPNVNTPVLIWQVDMAVRNAETEMAAAKQNLKACRTELAEGLERLEMSKGVRQAYYTVVAKDIAAGGDASFLIPGSASEPASA